MSDRYVCIRCGDPVTGAGVDPEYCDDCRETDKTDGCDVRRPLRGRRRAVAEISAPCVDCGVETLPADERRAEFYMVTDEVWAAAGMPDADLDEDDRLYMDDCLCIGCLELRIGRRLTPDDFTDCPMNDLSYADGHHAFSWRTPRLVDRLTRPIPTDTSG